MQMCVLWQWYTQGVWTIPRALKSCGVKKIIAQYLAKIDCAIIWQQYNFMNGMVSSTNHEPKMHQAITWSNDDPGLQRYMVSQGLSELIVIRCLKMKHQSISTSILISQQTYLNRIPKLNSVLRNIPFHIFQCNCLCEEWMRNSNNILLLPFSEKWLTWFHQMIKLNTFYGKQTHSPDTKLYCV